MPDRLADCGSTQKHTLIGFYEGGIASSVDDPPKRLRMYRITDRLIVMAFGTEDDLLSPFTPVLDHLSVL